MNPTVSDVLTALLWALVGGAVAWLGTMPFRRRSLTGLLLSVVLTGTAASVAAVLASVHEMILSMRDQTRTILVALVAGVLAALVAAVAARRLARDNEVLRTAIAQLGRGQVPDDDGGELSGELREVRTELGDVARALAETREREQNLESSRRELISWISHDLRTPLAGLRAVAEALEDGVADNPDLAYKQIAAAVERLSGMVEDLFDLSRLQAGAFSADTERLSLDDLVSDCLAALQPLAQAQSVRLTGSVSQTASVTGNGPELNRALTNVVANAIRHTPAGGTVDVRVGLARGGAGSPAGRGAGSGELAEVSVRDECGGIAADDLPRIFDVGYRGESARTPGGADPGGAGLGLAIARGILRAHEGSAEVENVAGGCRFTLRLPLSGAEPG